MPRFDVVGVGCCAWDYLTVVDHYPVADSKMDTDVLVEQGGGPTATAMVALARLGARASFVGKVGNDARGRLIVEELRREGVDTSHVVADPGGTSRLSISIVDRSTGQRTIVSYKGSAEPLRPEELSRAAIRSGKILHIDGHQTEAAIAGARWAREAGMTVILDAGSVRPRIEVMVELTDYLVASAVFARDFTGKKDLAEAARDLLQPHLKAVVVTAGDSGGFCVTHDEAFAYPAFRVKVVDTTGAGDVFHGAFDYGILRDWPMREVVRFASAVAALKCGELGGRAGIPSLVEVTRFLEKRR